MKITFDTDGGSEVAAIEVEKGSAISVTAPTKEGFTFKGWATEKGGAVAADLKADAEATLYAVWEANSVTPPADELAYETPKTVTWTGQWAGPTLTVEADWATVTVVFEEKPAGVQFCVSSDFVTSEESWGKAYQSTYPQIEGTTASVDVAAELAVMQAKEGDGSTKVEKIVVQNTEKFEGEVTSKTAKIKAIIVTLKDGSKKLVEASGDWGSKIE